MILMTASISRKQMPNDDCSYQGRFISGKDGPFPFLNLDITEFLDGMNMFIVLWDDV